GGRAGFVPATAGNPDSPPAVARVVPPCNSRSPVLPLPCWAPSPLHVRLGQPVLLLMMRAVEQLSGLEALVPPVAADLLHLVAPRRLLLVAHLLELAPDAEVLLQHAHRVDAGH